MRHGEDGEIHALLTDAAQFGRRAEVIAIVGMPARDKLWRPGCAALEQQQRGGGNIRLRPLLPFTAQREERRKIVACALFYNQNMT